MRNPLLIIAPLAAVSSIAAADPVPVAQTHEEPAAPGMYAEGAAVIGFNDGYLLGGVAMELGRRVTSFATVHGTLSTGLATEIFQQASGSVSQVRAGADLFTCNTPDQLCAYGGADVGIQQTSYSGAGCAAFEECYPSDRIDKHTSSAVGVARVGFDAGGPHVRVRIGLEGDFVGGHLNGMDLVTGLATRF